VHSEALEAIRKADYLIAKHRLIQSELVNKLPTPCKRRNRYSLYKKEPAQKNI
jgi:hypothetical protein